MASCISDCAPLACVPTAIPPGERAAHFALIHRLFGNLTQERAELPNGYAYRFQADALMSVARFIANERKCCPFLSFELVVSGDSGPMWLRVSGPAGTHAVLEAELAAESGLVEMDGR